MEQARARDDVGAPAVCAGRELLRLVQLDLRRFREAWDQQHSTPLAEEDIVLTVPASFDEEARELTVMAAEQAGLPKLTLLEEPAAAFYSWIANHLAQSQKALFDGQTVLVCDVGGGTSDFTLIKVQRDGDRVDRERSGGRVLVGDRAVLRVAEDDRGRIEIGARADLVVLTADLRVDEVWVGGQRRG